MNATEGEMMESMSFSFATVREDEAQLVFAWEKTKWMISINVAVTKLAMANIEDKIGEIENAYGVYNNSARYYLDHDQDLKQALEWSKKSVAISAKFWNVYTLSLIEYAMGDVKAAIASAERSLKLSEEAGYKPYIKRNKDNLEKWKK